MRSGALKKQRYRWQSRRANLNGVPLVQHTGANWRGPGAQTKNVTNASQDSLTPTTSPASQA
jgi:hypothetical protein